jgi:hypothetical protein
MRALSLICGMLVLVGCSGGGSPAAGPDQPDPPDQLAWAAIPALMLTVGVPVDADLNPYLTDSSGAAVITVDTPLPAGLQLNHGVIRGTPTAAAAQQDYTVTADNGSTTADTTLRVAVMAPPSAGITFERATPEQIGIYIPYPSSPPPADATATVRYKPTTGQAWRTGHPLLRIHPEWTVGGAPVTPIDAFAGTIFDLVPGTTYDVEVTIASPSMTTQTLRSVHATRSLPAASGPATVTATPADDLQAVVAALSPGDVLELAAGTYDVGNDLDLDVSGTAQAPITIRGADRDNVILSGSETIIQVLRASHVILEDLTLQGPGVDGLGAAKSLGVSFWDGTQQEFITFRRLTLQGVDLGIVAWGGVNSVLVYDCILRGNNEWTAPFIETSLTWDDDGIRLPGEGNCAFHNTLHAFGDSFAVNDGTMSAAVYYYRNRVTMTGDDTCEGDYGTRNMAFYDNHVTNCATLLSLDPIWGGPFYCFRNIAVNTTRGPFKFNSPQSGFMVYNNTIVRTDGVTITGWVQFNNGSLVNWSFRNNILIYHGVGALMALESDGMDPIDFTHNGWYPDDEVWWTNSGGSYLSLAAAHSNLNATTPVFGTSTQRHDDDLLLAREPFQTPIPLGADHLVEVTSLYVPALGATSQARNAGTAIPNVTDGHSGAAPDMGAVIAGRTTPAWGAR